MHWKTQRAGALVAKDSRPLVGTPGAKLLAAALGATLSWRRSELLRGTTADLRQVSAIVCLSPGLPESYWQTTEGLLVSRPGSSLVKSRTKFNQRTSVNYRRTFLDGGSGKSESTGLTGLPR